MLEQVRITHHTTNSWIIGDSWFRIISTFCDFVNMSRWKLIMTVFSAYLPRTHSFTVTVWNMCGKDITVYDNIIEETLADHSSLIRTYKKNDNGMIRMGRDPHATLAEFGFTSFAWYDISIVHPKAGNCSSLSKCLQATGSTAFNIDMEISPTKLDGARCVELHCLDKGCADAYKYPSDDTKTHACKLGTDFDLTFCPGNRKTKTPRRPNDTSSHPLTGNSKSTITMVTQNAVREESRDAFSITVADHTSSVKAGQLKTVTSDLAQKTSKLSFAYETSSTEHTSSSATIARVVPVRSSLKASIGEKRDKTASTTAVGEKRDTTFTTTAFSGEPLSTIASDGLDEAASNLENSDVSGETKSVEKGPVARVRAPSAAEIGDVTTLYFHKSSKEERLEMEEAPSTIASINMKKSRGGGSKVGIIVSLVVCISVIVAGCAVYLARKKKKLLDALDDKTESPQFLPNDPSSLDRQYNGNSFSVKPL